MRGYVQKGSFLTTKTNTEELLRKRPENASGSHAHGVENGRAVWVSVSVLRKTCLKDIASRTRLASAEVVEEEGRHLEVGQSGRCLSFVDFGPVFTRLLVEDGNCAEERLADKVRPKDILKILRLAGRPREGGLECDFVDVWDDL